MTVRGKCLCEEVTYEIDGSLGVAGHCHCSMCRRAHGAAFGTYAVITPDEFRWVTGEALVTNYDSSPNEGRCFCSRCGATLGATRHGQVTAITLGTVDGDPGVKPEAHLFAASKAPWHEITDGLPQFDEWPPGWDIASNSRSS